MANILVIDDEASIRELFRDIVGGMGHGIECACSADEGMKAANTRHFDAVFLDINLPDGNGLTLLSKIRDVPGKPEVIIMTGFGSVENAELAITNSAWDYIEKPIVKTMIELPLLRALQYRETKKETKKVLALRRESIIGGSSAINACLELVAQAAAGDVNALIAGETGTGKELIARTIHQNSRRGGKAFVTVDCASLPPTIIESVLFGHEKGAFTGADRQRAGLVKQADGGTLFLDEIGELPLELQKTFLRVLQEHRFRPVGSSCEIESRFRLIAATNRDLERMAQAGDFRSDLLYRLSTFTIEVPPLRKRLEDIGELILHYTKKFCDRYGTEMKGFSPEFLHACQMYDWPGNVRELVNVLEKAFLAALQEPILFPKHLPMHIRLRMVREVVGCLKTDPEKTNAPLGSLQERRKTAIAREEKQYLQELMAATDGDIASACRISGLSKVRLYVLLKKHGMARKDFQNLS
ncbi:MAG: Transcriptional regulatory protein ZraR [Syntrophaceae bacterium PtaU1.Bin231]|nr:MAG: Transcriptional regulatory protein ZraR [Syntrophaceae bacterium PtaU1.Bin231]HOG16570.1 sigma-54 dependent transcriptional regulator [Syntrophales bacterium]